MLPDNPSAMNSIIQLRIQSDSSCSQIEDLASLLVRQHLSPLHQPQEPEVDLHQIRVDNVTKKVNLEFVPRSSLASVTPGSTSKDQIVGIKLQLEPMQQFQNIHARVLDQNGRITRNKTTKFYKIQWSQLSKEETTLGNKRVLAREVVRFLCLSLSCNFLYKL